MNNKKILTIGLIVVIMAVAVYILIFGRKPVTLPTVTLEIWGVYDDSDIYAGLIADYKKEYSNASIVYKKMSYNTYEKDLLDAMASGRGPDIYMIHHTWLPRYMDRISPSPTEFFTSQEVSDEFVDVVYADLFKDGYMRGVPTGLDTLALYYNKDMFNTAGVAIPPATWQEFLEAVEQISEVDSRDNVITAGAAMGTARNVNRSTDILALLMMQSGAKMTNDNNTAVAFNERVIVDGQSFSPGESALRFYTDFANPLKAIYTWNARMHYSIDAFYEGGVAMMFNYSYHIPTIRAKAPYLNFDVVKMPQIENTNVDVNYANYWVLTVSNNITSNEKNEAWRFLEWLTKTEHYKTLLTNANRPTARRDLVAWQRQDEDMALFADQALTARSWHQVDNFNIEEYLADMIESVVVGDTTVEGAMRQAVTKINNLMR